MTDVMMVEGEAKECQEAELVEAIKVGHEAIKVQCQAQLELRKLTGEVAKRDVEVVEVNEELKEWVKKNTVDKILVVSRGALDKKTRKNNFKEIKDQMKADLLEEKGEEYAAEHTGTAKEYFEKIKKETIRTMVLDESVRSVSYTHLTLPTKRIV